MIATATKRALFWTAVIAVVCIATIVASTVHTIVHDSRQQQLHPADAIIVFGAAEYDGRPSPVLRARLDHANDLYRKGLAPVVITTGGAAADPNFSEGGVGRDYLMHKGVPEPALIAETQASDTAESAERVAVIMRANHMRMRITCFGFESCWSTREYRCLSRRGRIRGRDRRGSEELPCCGRVGVIWCGGWGFGARASLTQKLLRMG